MTLQKGVLLACMLSAVALAQTPPAEPISYYRIDFVIKEVEGDKVLNSRAYSMTTSTSARNAGIRTGSKIPYPTTNGYSYSDVGINIDCRIIKEENNRLILDLQADVSSTVPGLKHMAYLAFIKTADPQADVSSTVPGAKAILAPIIRQNRWTSMVIVPLNKPTIVFSSDDMMTKRQMQLEITAAVVK